MVRPRLGPSMRDAAVALALLAVTLGANAGLYFGGNLQRKIALAYFGNVTGLESALVWYWVFGALLFAGLVIAHRWPVVALVLVGVGGIGHQLDLRFAVQPLDLAVPFVLYVVASRASARWVSGVVLGATVLAAYVVRVRDDLTSSGKVQLPGGLVPLVDKPFPTVLVHAAIEAFDVVLVLVLAVAIGDGVHSRRANVRMLELRAADLEREQQQQAELAAAAERARISREMHDVVAHSLSVIVAQAQGAAAALERHPRRAAAAIANVVDTGRRSLAEMRRLLGVVRQGPAALEPGMAGLAALVGQMCSAGLSVGLDIVGDPVPLPAGVDLSAYRIVQEALTNALKHAGVGTKVLVRLEFTDDALYVDVTDDGPAPPMSADQPATNGHGLLGIAERVHLLGGDVTVGPVGTAGFRVRARLPVALSYEAAQ
jgi:signal transduction histidine kinase